MRYVEFSVTAALSGSLLLLGACSSPSAQHQASQRSSALIGSTHALVVPSSEGRITAALAGIAEPGSDFGVFAGRRDTRIGAQEGGPERIAFGYERRIYDRQYSTLGRPFNNYMNTTRSTTRVDR
jgi:hypothetical protein